MPLKALQKLHPSRRVAFRLVLLSAVSPFAIPASSFAADPNPLAIRGYDPVAYFTIGKPLPGLPEWNTNGTNGATALREQNIASCSKPTRYATRRNSPISARWHSAEGKIVEADPEYWLISEGKLYIFAVPAGPATFQQDKDANIDKANQNRKLLETR